MRILSVRLYKFCSILHNMYILSFLQVEEELDSTEFGLSISVVATFGFAFFLSSFVIFPITEKESKVCYMSCTSKYLGNC